jgi:hypothetical protein
MKKFVLASVVILFLFGCTGTQINQNAAMLTAIELGGYNLGYYVGKSKTDADDIAIANAYQLARTGTLSPAELAAAFAKFKIENAQLAGSLLIVMRNMGASFGTDGGLVSLSGIPVEYWDRAAAGYAAGYEFGKVGQKSVRVSAVVAIMPKK